jgi:alkylated DNA repair dioxygenase AlkB|tara:strand:- start:54 stop:635 length:582 start_codon:yes stop_codon:yes gene_type:complete
MMHFMKEGMKGYIPYIEKWDAPTERIFNGKKVTGRPTRAFGESSFEYAGKLYEPDPWTKNMIWIKEGAQEYVKRVTDQDVEFTFCLCGMYKNGRIGIPHHSDTVPTQKDLVVSISFGEPRIFQWREFDRRIKAKSNTSETDTESANIKKVVNYLMRDGDVFIFDGASQMTATHSVPKIRGVGERINLTFRTGL